MGATTVVLGGSLAAVFLVMVAILVWQEGRRRSFDEGPAYVLEDAVVHVAERLDEPEYRRLGVDGVRRILEWELRYLQTGGDGGPVVAGGDDRSVAYVMSHLAANGGPSYARSDVAAVLALEADYLLAIGALGSPASDGGES